MNIQSTAPSGAPRTERSTASEAPGTMPAATATKGNTAPAPSSGVQHAKATDEAEPSGAELKSAIDKLNLSMKATSQELQFSVDEDSKKTVVKLIDRNTHEVLRQMPTKEALEIAKSIDKAMGKLIDQHA